MQTVELNADTTNNLTFVLPEQTATLRGRLVDGNGHPLADVRLRVTLERMPPVSELSSYASALTRADGSFLVPNLVSSQVYNVIVVRGYDEKIIQRDVSPSRPIVLTLAGGS